MTLAHDLGAAIRRRGRRTRDPIAAALGVMGGEGLFSGKIVDVERRMAAGFARGAVALDGLGDWRGAEPDDRFPERESDRARRPVTMGPASRSWRSSLT